MIQTIIYSFITSLAITYMAIPSIIYIANVKKLYDEPGIRKSHTGSIPTLGGLAIFAGLIFSISFWTDFSQFWNLQYILAALLVVFGMGIKDDIVTLSAFKKALGQLFAAVIIVIWGKIRITSFSGIFGIEELHEVFSIFFSIFVILTIINAVNLIDGINGLSASLGIIASITFGTWFYMTGELYQLSIISFALAGSLLAFLKFNVTPAKIFMGDTGSMLLGLMLAILAIEMIDLNEHYDGISAKLFSAPAIAIAILFVPLYDMMRVFIIRIFRGKSPFKADKCHIHHLLLKLDLNHTQATLTLSLFSLFFIALAVILDSIGNYYLIILLAVLGYIFSYFPQYLLKLKRKKENK